MFKKALLSLAILVVLSLLWALNTATAFSDENVLSIVKQQNNVKYRAILNEPDLLTMLYIGSNDNWLVTVTRKPKPDELPIYKLSFYQKIKNRIFRKIYEYTAIDRFQTAYTTTQNPRLEITWK